jgi:hypothetical protein
MALEVSADVLLRPANLSVRLEPISRIDRRPVAKKQVST